MSSINPPLMFVRKEVAGYAFYSSAVLPGAHTVRVGSLHGANMQRHVRLTFIDNRMDFATVLTLAEAQALAGELLEAVAAMQAATAGGQS